MVYYNENDKETAAWLRELARNGLVAKGIVDERSVKEVRPGDLDGFDQCHFFAGIGGWSYALRLAGWPDDRPVWTGSCPCQSFSDAGEKRGFLDPRHLWPWFFDLIAARRPPVVFGEQVEAATRRGEGIVSWLDLVHGDLGQAGYEVGSAVLPALYVGAPHMRERLYFVADSDGLAGISRRELGGEGVGDGVWSEGLWDRCPDRKRLLRRPGSRLVADGLPEQLAILRGAGNAIVPQQAAEFIRAYVEAKEGLNRVAFGGD